MSQRGSIYRYGLIVKKLKQKPYSTFEEIRSFIEYQLSFVQMTDYGEDLSVGLSLRTFQREIKTMNLLYGISIEYSRKDKGYFLNESLHDHSNFERMMDAFDIFNNLNLAQDVDPFIFPEKRKQLGVEHLYELLRAIKKSHMISINYHKFGEEFGQDRVLKPYGIKEFKHRWYLIASDENQNIMKTFALDRITSVEQLHVPFERLKDIDIEKNFEQVFGIYNAGEESEEVILSVQPYYANYLKTLPLHTSQKIIKDDKKECIISLEIQITQDFIMELLSFGAEIQVVSPFHLRLRLKDILQDTLNQYK